MVSLFKWALAWLLIAESSILIAAVDLTQARALSFAIRDHGLNSVETKALLSGQTTLDQLRTTWLGSEDHHQRMLRHYDDIIGFGESFNLLTANTRITPAPEGFFFNLAKGTCQSSETVSVSAWWLPDGQQIKVCPNISSSILSFTENGKTMLCAPGQKGFQDARCGCGAMMMMCAPQAQNAMVQKEMRVEFATRAYEVYKNKGTWLDLLAGEKFFGTRRLYWVYLTAQNTLTPGLWADSVDKLMDVPLDQAVVRDFPTGVERSGVATLPGFLMQYNNFRSRIAVLTRSFLCQDVDPSLNTDGISSFVNKDLSATDIAHGSNPDCSSCHYALDNMGSALMSFSSRGIADPKIAKDAHAFGVTGVGPKFLMQGYIERAPGFSKCMVKRAWESFSGISIANLTPEIQTNLNNMYADPYNLVQSILASKELENVFTGSIADGGRKPEFDWTEVTPIAEKNCGGSSCHGTGSHLPLYAVNPDLWPIDASKIISRIQMSGSGQMPPVKSGRVLDANDRAILLDNLSPSN